MKVLLQEWAIPGGGTSISRNRAEIRTAYKRVKRKIPWAKYNGGPTEINIPDDSVFAEMVATRGTVFLSRDETETAWDYYYKENPE